MGELIFSAEQLAFKYIKDQHLETVLKIKNPTNLFAHFKFRLTEPKSYLVKNTVAVIKPQEQISVSFMLHLEGVSSAHNDKIKCLYGFSKTVEDQSIFQNLNELTAYKIRVVVNGLPEDMKKSGIFSARSSRVRSVLSGSRPTGTMENSIKEKESKITVLKQEIEELRRKSRGEKKKSSRGGTYLWAGIILLGLGMGVASSFWI